MILLASDLDRVFLQLLIGLSDCLNEADPLAICFLCLAILNQLVQFLLDIASSLDRWQGSSGADEKAQIAGLDGRQELRCFSSSLLTMWDLHHSKPSLKPEESTIRDMLDAPSPKR